MSCPTRLLFIRHAQADDSRNGQALLCGRHDVPLSAAGRAQVERLRVFLAARPAPAAVYASSLRRALETARAAERARPLRSLSEIDCGAVEGWPLDEVQSRYTQLWARNLAQADDHFRWPGGETYAAFRRRVVRVVRAIARRHPGCEVLVFTHAGVISQILGWMRGESPARWAKFRPGTASLTRIAVDGGRWVLESFDDRSHLTGASTRPRGE